VDFLIYLFLVAVFTTYFAITQGTIYISLGVHTLLALAGAAMAFGLAMGLGLVTAVLGAETRDLRFTLPYVLSFWFLLTPGVYPLSRVPEDWRPYLLLNPMTSSIELFRWGLFGTPSALRAEEIAAHVAIVLLTLAGGIWYFLKAERTAVDRI
jgi:lipopolysaccharide transport system permease protein